MKKWLFIMLFLLLPVTAHAEDVYCGDYNGKPAYVDVDSIQKHSYRTGDWIAKSSGIYPELSRYYSANIFADGLWYEVCFSLKTQRSTSVWILDKNKKSTHEPVDTLNFNFAFDTVDKYYPEANRRHEEAAKKNLEEMDKQKIEAAKKNSGY